MGSLIAADKLVKRFPVRQGWSRRELVAVNEVTLGVGAGEIVGLVGESGSGKSTLSRMLIGIEPPSAGRILLNGSPVATPNDWKVLRRNVQYVFQDPFSALPPHMMIGDILTDPLQIHGIGTKRDRRDRAALILELVGLPASTMRRVPSQFSGGQRQRISLARALILEPRVVLCDEIVSSLDVSIQSQVLNLLLDLHEKLDLAYLFISHDLRVIHYLCDRVAVMYMGQIVEVGSATEVFKDPLHPYTRGLLASIPDHRNATGTLNVGVRGEPPGFAEKLPGCPYAPRCPIAQSVCVETSLVETNIGSRSVRCHFPGKYEGVSERVD